MSISSPYGGTVLNGTTIAIGGISWPDRFDISYVVQDTLGATATGILEVTVLAGSGCD